MSPVLRMCLLTQIQLHHAAPVPVSHTTDLYCRCLTYSSSKDNDDTPTDKLPSPNSTPPVQYHTYTLQQPSSKYTLNMYVTLEEEEEEEEDFQTFLLDDEHWDMEEIPDRHLHIHEHSLPHRLMSISMSIFRIASIIILQHTGFQQTSPSLKI